MLILMAILECFCYNYFVFLWTTDIGVCLSAVISVRSARQVIDALNAEGPDIDLILAEVDIPMAKGMKMLKYITRHKDLRRIPVISKHIPFHCEPQLHVFEQITAT